MARKRRKGDPPPPPWTPADVRIVAEGIYGPMWQTPLAADIAAESGRAFQQSRIAKWYLAEGGRPISDWLQPLLWRVFEEAQLQQEQRMMEALYHLRRFHPTEI